MPEIVTTATTDTARVYVPQGNVVYVNTQSTGSSYTVAAQPPTPRQERPQR